MQYYAYVCTGGEQREISGFFYPPLADRTQHTYASMSIQG